MSGNEARDGARVKLAQVFRYLQALHHLRNPVECEITDQPWTLWFHDLPEHPAIRRGTAPDAASDLEGRAGSKVAGTQQDRSRPGDGFILKVNKPQLADPPEPPQEIRPWLQGGWQQIDAKDLILPSIEDPAGHLDASGQRQTIRFDADPRRRETFVQWKARRDAWADVERPARRAMALYERLYALQARLERESEQVELLLGDGLLTWPQSSGQSVHHPVLLLRVQLQFNPDIPEFTVVEAEDPPELYTALFRALPDVQASNIASARTDLEQNGWHPLGGEETTHFLRRLIGQLSPRGSFGSEGIGREGQDAPRITRDPVLFLRKRTLGFNTALESILEDVPQRDTLPHSLTSMVGLVSPPEDHSANQIVSILDSPNGEDEQALLSKPANAEQVEIVRRLEKYGAVLVQGPPGTGKTHTIANLLGHLLAQGKSVLVTSHTTKALKVLREQVVEPLQPLCVSVLDENSKQLESAVDAITERLASSDADALERQASQHLRTRVELLRQLREARQQLQEARYDEYRPIVIAGEQYTPSQAAKRIADRRQVDGWIPAPAQPAEPLPLSAGELIELYHSNASVTPEDEKELSLTLPDPLQLLTSDEFKALVDEGERLRTADVGHRSELWKQVPGDRSPEALERLDEQLRLGIDPLQADERWRIAAIAAGRDGGPYRQTWDDLLTQIKDVSALAAQAQPTLLNYDPIVPDDCLPDDVESVLGDIWGYLKGGGKLSSMRLLMHKDWKTVIESTQVKGRMPELPEHFEALRTLVRLRAARADLRDRWQRQMQPLGAPDAEDLGTAPERTCQQYVPILLQCLDWFPTVWAPLARALNDQGFNVGAFLAESPVNLAEHGDLMRLRDAVLQRLPAILAAEANRRLAERNKARFLDLQRRLELSGGSAARPDVVQRLLAAVERRDVPAYREAFERLVDLHARHTISQRRQALLATLQKVAPAWANAIRNRVGDHGKGVLPGKPDDAWLWRQLYEEVKRRATTSLEDLQEQIQQLSADLQRTTALLVENKAWAAQVRRTTPQQRQALTGWKQTIQRVGKGTGKRAAGLLAQARRYMPLCQSAVPVWIMPLSRVVENFSPREIRFDVVIIDEASQADLMALTAVYLGRQVVVVGDDEQVSPLAVGQSVEEVERLIREHLPGIPNAHLYDGQYSIYNLAETIFQPVCLREHFRCVPPIIEFSNQLSYEGKIKPLRDVSQVRRQPYTVAFRSQSTSSNDKVNEQEALEVASLLVAATEQPEYAGATCGVISLVGDEQALRIDALLQRHLTPTEYQRRRVQCGNPAHFQGDERDVMFLSMVQTSSGKGPLPLIDRDRKPFRQRYNVAASRARDQLWVVHSLDPEVDLKPGDIRRRLIEHALDPEAVKRAQESQERQTESEFERQVLLLLRQGSYRVIPQWPVGAYRIDLVVEGGGKRLAIECDGDRYHSREQLVEDMGRQAILERLGWRFVRLRGSEFFRNPQKTMEPVFARLRDLEIPPEGTQKTTRPQDPDAEELKARIIRRAAELRREWAEKGDEALSYSGMITSRQMPSPSQSEATAKSSPPLPVSQPPAEPGPPAPKATPTHPPTSPAPSVTHPAPPGIPSSTQSGKGTQEFVAGDRVKHPQFGMGKVIKVFTASNDRKVIEVDFGGQFGVHSVDVAFKRLEKIQEGP